MLELGFGLELGFELGLGLQLGLGFGLGFGLKRALRLLIGDSFVTYKQRSKF